MDAMDKAYLLNALSTRRGNLQESLKRGNTGVQKNSPVETTDEIRRIDKIMDEIHDTPLTGSVPVGAIPALFA